VTELRADAVTVRYGPVVGVRDVTLAAGTGDMIAVTGPSGAGKTSLLSALAGVRPPSAGRVTVDGIPLRDRDDAIVRGVVYVPQGNALVLVLTAQENVAVPLVARRRRPEHAREAATEALAAVGLGEAGDQLVEELSGGQQQRAAVARGLAEKGRVLLADEPTSELDATNRARVTDLLRAEAARGAVVIMATHDPEAAATCDAELHLDEGNGRWVRDDRISVAESVG
jgi:putative ABC transport system ATP-binding protein